eukprot:scaffold1072_cov118-Isochrysis_galbana.AAC.7
MLTLSLCMLLPSSLALHLTPATAPRARTVPRAGAHPVCAIDDKAEVEEYFNNEGFNRWNRIYSEDGEVNAVQMDIRTGHAQTVDKILAWVDADGPDSLSKGIWCDAGCGVGSLALPLAARGATVVASDISDAMATEAARRATKMGLGDRATFCTSDLESLDGQFDTVSCIDVSPCWLAPERRVHSAPSSRAWPAGRAFTAPAGRAYLWLADAHPRRSPLRRS